MVFTEIRYFVPSDITHKWLSCSQNYCLCDSKKSPLIQGGVKHNFFYEESGYKYFRLCNILGCETKIKDVIQVVLVYCTLYVKTAQLWEQHESSHIQYVNKWCGCVLVKLHLQNKWIWLQFANICSKLCSTISFTWRKEVSFFQFILSYWISGGF